MSRSTTNHIVNRPLFKVDEQLRDWMIGIRRHLHQHPELSFEEHRTAALVQEKLAELGIPSTGGVGGTGVVAMLGADDADLPCVALRADMDALPVQERSRQPFASIYPGKMHSCGHDGHVAMLLGAAALLSRLKRLPGRVKLVFQPAEEHGNGAEVLVNSGVIDGVGAIFGGHIDTHYATGQITVDEGIICAYTDPFDIKLTGRSGHAARPHEATDAIVAAASLVMTIQTLISREVNPNVAEVITIGSLQAGTVHNVIAGEALLKGTVRSTDEQTRIRTLDGLVRVVKSMETLYGVQAEIVFNGGLPAVVNNPRSAEIARAAAWDTTSVDKVISQGRSSLGGEDFAFYQQRIDGCLVRFGAALDNGAGPSHSDTFDFDEGCLEIGCRWLANVAWRWLDLARLPVVEGGRGND